MKTSLAHLPEHKQAEVKAIKEALIPRFTEIEMIILFGSYARGGWVEDKYVEDGVTYEYKSDYDLLIVLSKNNLANNYVFTETITDKLNDLTLPTPVNPIFDGIEFVNKELQVGSYFFGDIKKEGIVLFDTTRYQLDNKRELSPKEVQAIAKEDYEHWFKSANMFFEQFIVAYKSGTKDEDYFKVAAFQLHQATERYYGAIQLVFTGYKPKTHDLVVLGRMAKICNMQFSKVFPQATHEERSRFSQLRHAYVDARYKKEYKISKEDLAYLSERVKLLRNLTEKICIEKISGFTA
jgi:predicted nucleotidyltransferase/HEPN domain-containing protein